MGKYPTGYIKNTNDKWKLERAAISRGIFGSWVDSARLFCRVPPNIRTLRTLSQTARYIRLTRPVDFRMLIFLARSGEPRFLAVSLRYPHRVEIDRRIYLNFQAKQA